MSTKFKTEFLTQFRNSQKEKINIPVQICQDALINKKVRALQIFVWLKINSSGKIKIDKKVLEKMASDFGLKSPKILKSHIDYLAEKQWISKSKKSGYYFIKGFERIRKIEGFYYKTAAEFNPKDFMGFKGFVIASVLSQLISIQKKRKITTELKSGSSKTVRHLPQIYFPIANEAVAKILKVSISTAYEWKKLAAKNGFIKIRKSSKRLDIPISCLANLRKYGNKDFTKKLKVKKTKIFEQMPDYVMSNIVLKTRKKIETY